VEVTFAPAAAADIFYIRSYIGHFNPAAAKRMAGRIKAAALSLGDFAERGRLRHDGARELTIVPPYIIVYDVGPNAVTVLRVWHGAQSRAD
jgi:plasmid stabilization system protein ParE